MTNGTVDWKDFYLYLLTRTGCIHPFRLSRLGALVELKYMERTGSRLTNARYVAGPGVFYIEDFKNILDLDCVEKREGDPQKGVKGCIRSNCPHPRVDDTVKQLIEEVLKEYSSLDDFELNNAVVNHPLFNKLTRG